LSVSNVPSFLVPPNDRSARHDITSYFSFPLCQQLKDQFINVAVDQGSLPPRISGMAVHFPSSAATSLASHDVKPRSEKDTINSPPVATLLSGCCSSSLVHSMKIFQARQIAFWKRMLRSATGKFPCVRGRRKRILSCDRLLPEILVYSPV
jgi:hypothetical protein